MQSSGHHYNYRKQKREGESDTHYITPKLHIIQEKVKINDNNNDEANRIKSSLHPFVIAESW